MQFTQSPTYTRSAVAFTGGGLRDIFYRYLESCVEGVAKRSPNIKIAPTSNTMPRTKRPMILDGGKRDEVQQVVGETDDNKRTAMQRAANERDATNFFSLTYRLRLRDTGETIASVVGSPAISEDVVGRDSATRDSCTIRLTWEPEGKAFVRNLYYAMNRVLAVQLPDWINPSSPANSGISMDDLPILPPKAKPEQWYAFFDWYDPQPWPPGVRGAEHMARLTAKSQSQVESMHALWKATKRAVPAEDGT